MSRFLGHAYKRKSVWTFVFKFQLCLNDSSEFYLLFFKDYPGYHWQDMYQPREVAQLTSWSAKHTNYTIAKLCVWFSKSFVIQVIIRMEINRYFGYYPNCRIILDSFAINFIPSYLVIEMGAGQVYCRKQALSSTAFAERK